MEKIQTKMAKLAIEADSNVVGEVFIAKPEKDLPAKLGIFFSLAEIYNTDDTFTNKLYEVLSDLRTEFYLPPYGIDHSPEKRFEEALARANRRLHAAYSSSIDEINLKNINVIVGLSRKNQIYLSQIGHGKGFLFHRKKNWETVVLDILGGEDSNYTKTDPEKMFSSVLSGEINDNDSLLICNEEFMGYFSQSELAQTLDQKAPDLAMTTLGEIIKERSDKANFYAIVIKSEGPEKVLVENAGPNKTTKYNPEQPQKSLDRLLNTQNATEKYLAPSMMPSWQKILIIIWNFTKKYSKIGYKNFKIGLTAAATAGKSAWQKWQANRTAKAGKAVSPTHYHEIEKSKPIEGLNIDANTYPVDHLKSSDDFSELATTNELEPETTGAFLTDEDDVANIAEVGIESESATPINQQKSHLEADQEIGRKNHYQTEVGQPIPIKHHSTGRRTLAQVINDWLNGQIVKFLTLKRAQQIILVIGLILLFLFSQSVVWLGRAEETANGKIPTNNKSAMEIETLLNNAEAQNIFNDEIGALASVKKAREVLDKMSNSFGTRELKKQLSEKIETGYRNLQKITYLDNLAIFAEMPSDNLVGPAKTTKYVWLFDNKEKTLYKIDGAGQLESRTSTLPNLVKFIAIDDGYLAALAKDKSFYRYDTAKKSWQKTTPGKDYFSFKLPTVSPLLDPPLASSTKATFVNGDLTFILDNANNRIVILGKTGAIERQYVSPAIKDATGLTASTKEKKLWLISGNKVYKIDFDF